MISYENWTTGNLFRKWVPTHLLFGTEFIARIYYKLRVRVVPCCHWKFFVYSEWSSTYSEQRDNTMRQVVACKRSKTVQYCMQKPPGGQQVIAVAAAVTYERWNFTRGFIIGFWRRKFWCVGWAVAYRRWLLTRDRRTWRFDSMVLLTVAPLYPRGPLLPRCPVGPCKRMLIAKLESE